MTSVKRLNQEQFFRPAREAQAAGLAALVATEAELSDTEAKLAAVQVTERGLAEQAKHLSDRLEAGRRSAGRSLEDAQRIWKEASEAEAIIIAGAQHSRPRTFGEDDWRFDLERSRWVAKKTSEDVAPTIAVDERGESLYKTAVDAELRSRRRPHAQQGIAG